MQTATTGSQEIDQLSLLAAYAFILHWYDAHLPHLFLPLSHILLFPAAVPTPVATVSDSRVISMYAARVDENCPISGDVVAFSAWLPLATDFISTESVQKAAVSAAELATVSTLTSALDDIVYTGFNNRVSITYTSKLKLKLQRGVVDKEISQKCRVSWQLT